MDIPYRQIINEKDKYIKKLNRDIEKLQHEWWKQVHEAAKDADAYDALYYKYEDEKARADELEFKAAFPKEHLIKIRELSEQKAAHIEHTKVGTEIIKDLRDQLAAEQRKTKKWKQGYMASRKSWDDLFQDWTKLHRERKEYRDALKLIAMMDSPDYTRDPIAGEYKDISDKALYITEKLNTVPTNE